MSATCLTMLPAIGAKVTVRFESLTIDCTVKDVKNAWGKPRLLIEPETGRGQQWIELSRVATNYPSASMIDRMPVARP